MKRQKYQLINEEILVQCSYPKHFVYWSLKVCRKLPNHGFFFKKTDYLHFSFYETFCNEWKCLLLMKSKHNLHRNPSNGPLSHEALFFLKKCLYRWYTNILIGTAILTISVWAECTSLDPTVFLQCVVRRGTVTAPYKTIKCSKIYIPSTINTWKSKSHLGQWKKGWFLAV